MCCLRNEQEAYEELNKRLPDIGDFIRAYDGNKGEVQSVNVLKQTVKVIITNEQDEKEVMIYKVTDLKTKPKRRKEKVDVDEELKVLESLERNSKSKLDDD